eukprot:TRINITY_DN32389_c1_g1_i1.p1 TRINITY_DN32389_c1_g1~~TRINITY_DN32389_c1_g1_i1.p1  ORF type:complete len:123 (-),score=33.71 TRINITY_DN32389_c1_g1_i1:369-737(-)
MASSERPGSEPSPEDSAIEVAELRQLEAAIAGGDVDAAATLARSLAQRRVVVTAELDREAAGAMLRRQLQATLIGRGFAPARVVQALRKGGAQSVDEAIAWMNAQLPAAAPAQQPPAASAHP